MEGTSTPEVTKMELREKLERLLRREREVTKMKEADAAAHNDELKQIRGEIKSTLDEIDDLDSI